MIANPPPHTQSLPALVCGPEDFCAFVLLATNYSKTDQYGTGKVLPISEELLDLLNQWKRILLKQGSILRSINKHGYIEGSLKPASTSTIIKTLQEWLKFKSNEQPLSSHSFKLRAALDLLEQGKPLDKIMLRGGWQRDLTAMKYSRYWLAFNFKY